MKKKNQFGLWLKSLRTKAGKTAAQIVDGTGISRQVIYKAELGKESTRLTTLRIAYKPLCRNEDQWVDLVLQWALNQEGAGISYEQLRDAFNVLRESYANQMSETAENLAYVLQDKSEDSVKLVKRVITHAENPGLQRIVHSYLDALEEARTA